jgi:hypothetical protein
MAEIMTPAPASGASGGLPAATPSNFGARVAANSAQQSQQQQPPPQVPIPQPRQTWDQFGNKPQVDGSQFEGAMQPGQAPPSSGEEGLQGEVLDQDGNPVEGEQPPIPGMTPEQQQQLMAKIQESFQTGIMPEELMDMWTVKVPWGEQGNFKEVPARELQKSFMRQSDYTRGKTQVMEHAQTLQKREAGLNGIFAKFDTPEGMETMFRQLGKDDVAEAFAKNVLKKWWEEEKIVRSLPPQQQQAYRERLQKQKLLERSHAQEVRRREEAERVASTNQTQQQQQERAQFIQRQIDQMRPMAFKANSIADTPYHRSVFEKELVAVVNSLPYRWNGEITREIAWQAAQGAREIIDDDQRKALAANRQQAGNPQQPMNPLRLPAGPNSQTPQQRQNGQRRRPGQFGDDMRTRNGGRPAF